MDFKPALLASLAMALTVPSAAAAQSCETFSGLPVPRFVTLRFDEAAGRAGPSRDHPISWMYQRAGLPVQIIEETVDWRRVRDPDGALVWMHRRLLSGRRSVRALGETALLARPDEDSSHLAVIEPNAILWLERCRSGWCRIEADGRRGWARAAQFWGVYRSEAEPASALEASQDPCYRDTAETTDGVSASSDLSASR